MHAPSRHLLPLHAVALAAVTAIAGAPASAGAAGGDAADGVRWSTYYGDSGIERGPLVVTARDGGVFLAGQTNSTRNIATGHAYQTAPRGDWDAALVHLGADGERRWATYFGGAGAEQPHAIARDHAGAIYLVGSTRSEAHIAGEKAHQNHLDGPQDGFLVKFSDRGDRLWSTYLGGDGDDILYGVAVDPDGDLYVCGSTTSDTHLAHGDHLHQPHRIGDSDAFLAKFDDHGAILWSTYFGGAGHDACLALAAHGDRVHITGRTTSPDRIATPGAFQRDYSGDGDAFVAAFDDHGQRLWGTYFGGGGHDRGEAIAVDTRRDIYIAGTTNSATSVATDDDLFLLKLSDLGQHLWATYYGGDDHDARADLVVRGDRIILGGDTRSHQGIATDDAAVPDLHGPSDLFYVEFNRHGDRRHATYLGGEDHEFGLSLAFSADDELYLAGATRSNSQIATEDAHDEQLSGPSDLFVTRINLDEARSADALLVELPNSPTTTCDYNDLGGDTSLAILLGLAPLALWSRRPSRRA